MKTDRTYFKKGEKGVAMEEAQDRGSQFYENLDGTAYVPKREKKGILKIKKKRKVKKRRK